MSLCVSMLIGNMGIASAQTAPVGAGFNLNPSDLRFILQQIKIAERHAKGNDGFADDRPGTGAVDESADTPTHDNPQCQRLLGPDADQIPDQTNQGIELPLGLRTVDGTCNNLVNGTETNGRRFREYGAADTTFPRRTQANFRPGENGTTYAQNGNVVDSRPRVISNLVVDQTETNPAAVAIGCAHFDANGDPVCDPTDQANPDPVDPDSGTITIPNVAPDTGLSAPFNSWFTFFGQFFDHGLDLVTKGGNGTVIVPLQNDDPLVVGADGQPGTNDDLPSALRFMPLSRATNQPGPDGQIGTADDIKEHTNTTTSFVDQNQTYTSHPSHQVFLREYGMSGGVPVANGKMLDGVGANIGNWAEVKDQAENLLGINLEDMDALNIPLLKTDPYGRFLRGPNGFPLIQRADGTTREGNPAANGGTGVNVPGNALRTNHAFLDDIAHRANPFGDLADNDNNPNTPPPQGERQPDGDNVAGSPSGPPLPGGQYDDELLNAHFVTGDGRGNENIALTAVHTVFHSEHNRLVGHIKSVLEGPNADIATPAEWHVPGANGVRETTDPYDGERIFEAARFVTEMEYQHLVFEEFARKVQPMVNAFGEGGVGYHTRIDPSIVAEFAHTVYRFGHSMLPERIARTDPASGTPDNLRLLTGFLNPVEFNEGGTLDAAAAAGRVAQGSTRQIGNEIDEFVVDAVRNNLLGLPLDLPSINMARGRDTGIPPLNAARRQFFAESQDSQVKPYASWVEFGLNIKHPESLVNFIAAYGTHPTITGATTLAAKRDEAQAILDGASDPVTPNQDALNFLNSTGQYANQANGVTTTGVDAIDFWMGGLAEKQMVFGGLLGSSFNYIFEKQMENLQDADRFYYLSRTAGLNLLTQLEGNSFAELVMRTTDAEGLPADAFSRPGFIFNLGSNPGIGTTGPIEDDTRTPDVDETMIEELFRTPDGTTRYAGPEHVVFNGTPGNDKVWSSEGDDTIRGNDGNDTMEGGDGVDNLVGGLGDDIMTDVFGDDTLKGGDGNDALSSGRGFGGDLNQGGRNKDFIIGGNDMTETLAGPGDDFVFAGDHEDTVFGDDGNDWVEAGDGPFNLIQGDAGAPFQNDPNEPGHDVLDGDGGEQDMDSEGGDDVMLMGPGIQRAEGMLGFDWATHKGDPEPADSDMSFTGLLPPTLDNNRDRFDLAEALSGWNFNDTLRGDDRVANVAVVPGDEAIGNGHTLTQAGINRISGLPALVGTGVTSFNSGNIIIGGAGNDLIEGRGGNDIVDGDRWLDVQIQGPNAELADSMAAFRDRIFAGTISPNQLAIVRSIKTATGGTDTAEFSGPRADYNFPDGVNATNMRVVHARGTQADGTDRVRNVERLRFADVTVNTANNTVVDRAPAAPVIGNASPGAIGGARTAIVRWSPPASNGGSPITGYVARALRMSGSGTGATVLERIDSPVLGSGARQHEFTLPNGNNYRFTVRAINDAGQGPFSNRSNNVTPR